MSRVYNDSCIKNIGGNLEVYLTSMSAALKAVLRRHGIPQVVINDQVMINQLLLNSTGFDGSNWDELNCAQLLEFVKKMDGLASEQVVNRTALQGLLGEISASISTAANYAGGYQQQKELKNLLSLIEQVRNG
jgi:hypothetical protein